MGNTIIVASLPDAAEMPWKKPRYVVGNISAGIMNVNVFAPIKGQPVCCIAYSRLFCELTKVENEMTKRN